jgi:hypothetical protein
MQPERPLYMGGIFHQFLLQVLPFPPLPIREFFQ